MNNLHRLLAVASAAFFITSAQAQNAGTVTSHAFAVGKGAGITGYTSVLCTAAQLAVGQSAADPICKTITGDITITSAGVTAIGAGKVTNSMIASMTSAQLAGILSDETGTGAAYFVGGALGTPASATLTNATGLPLAGHAAQNAFTFVGNNTSGSASPTAVDIALLTSKASPASTDLVMISDQAASGAWKKVTVSSLASAGSVASLGGQTGAITVTGPLAMSGTALTLGSTNTAHGVAVFEGTSAMGNSGAGTTGQALVSNGASADPSFKSGGWTLLNTLTASASATLSDTTSLTSTYNEYEIVFDNLVPATASVTAELQVHSGGSFQATNYVYALGGSNVSGTTFFQGSSSNTFIPLTDATSTPNTAPGVSGTLRVKQPSTSTIHFFMGNTARQNVQINMNGYWNTSGAVDGFQFLFSSGNITSGTIKIYGRL